ncbi:hypothetical protein HQ325_09720 [Rhodococcus sp. BP-349]|jgi:hypothetical protein|uniref:hypothetical protein n=1 Tax=unclassified Rhodococcus (in: high G+C Gram-positive bacteria) TaxID=192944 RepID=UPI001C9A93D0|nr:MULTISPECIES: hypothetical protein [unclassified Rhodococcus (in: high G+C Gram-positive bacteria)]MBY6538951.1 hypothetical protein [Rhodococcus sp. BP-363]MBY6543288.1 hypothetical protein [Rhodococcus sp. BP-369]MBY6562518.1 hypothetical protein [Rhodococcus sp. BP-370]MBY6576810.1 hypothetical protein [Rhodococcus sp. BP-364]MBY6586111.1 hypothetical protein [Rhodococcus sp. BP-358]
MHDGTDGHDITDSRSRWGRTTFDDGRYPALWAAAPFGAVAALAIAAALVLTDSAGPRPAVGAVAAFVVCLWPCVGLAWVVLVDRNTLRGAPADPEHSVESAWYDRAAGGAFTDLLLITGLGTAGLAISGTDVSAVPALGLVLVVAMGSFGLRYQLARRRV